MTPARIDTWRRARLIQNRIQALNFARMPEKTAPWAWLMLVAGLAGTLWLASEADRLHQARQDASDELRRLERADRQTRLARAMAQPARPRDHVAPAAPLTAQAPDLAPAAYADILAMTRLLSHPWLPQLDELAQSATAAKAVLLTASLDLSGSGTRQAPPPWRVQAALQDEASALAWAGTLNDGQVSTLGKLATPFSTVHGRYDIKAEALYNAAGGEAPAPAKAAKTRTASQKDRDHET